MKKTALFCGYGSLGLTCLKELAENEIEVLYVLTHKDQSTGSVDGFCDENGLPYSYSDLRKENTIKDELIQIKPFYLISVNYRYILPVDLISHCTHALNLHGSLLPKYRGRTPHVWSIINGEKKSGVTCHVMESTVDTGDLYCQISIDIEQKDTGYSLLKKLEQLYPVCLNKSLVKIKENIKPVPQDHSNATYFGKRIPEMGYIDFTKDSHSLINFIRAQAHPYPGAYCYLSDGRKLKVYSAETFDGGSEKVSNIGQIHTSSGGYYTRVKDGYLLFLNYEIE